MTNKEVIAELRSRLKPYVGVRTASGKSMTQAYFSQTTRQIDNGMCKPATVEKFFSLFGYAGQWNEFHKTSKTKDK